MLLRIKKLVLHYLPTIREVLRLKKSAVKNVLCKYAEQFHKVLPEEYVHEYNRLKELKFSPDALVNHAQTLPELQRVTPSDLVSIGSNNEIEDISDRYAETLRKLKKPGLFTLLRVLRNFTLELEHVIAFPLKEVIDKTRELYAFTKNNEPVNLRGLV